MKTKRGRSNDARRLTRSNKQRCSSKKTKPRKVLEARTPTLRRQDKRLETDAGRQARCSTSDRRSRRRTKVGKSKDAKKERCCICELNPWTVNSIGTIVPADRNKRSEIAGEYGTNVKRSSGKFLEDVERQEKRYRILKYVLIAISAIVFIGLLLWSHSA